MTNLAQSDIKPGLKTRRVVTGLDKDGRSIILNDDNCAVSVAIHHPDNVVTDAWRVDSLPAENGDYIDPISAVELEPAPGGNVVRIVSFAPESQWLAGADIGSGFAQLGDSGTKSTAAYESAPHPTMHQTDTLDYIIVIKGEVYAVLEKEETLLKAGDVLIQRGTNHAWSNRSTEPCIVAAILNGAKPLPRHSD